MNLNVVILCGNLVDDPEVKMVGDKKKTTFRLAVNDRNEASFFTCETWGATAETVEMYAKKGFEIVVQGSVRIEEFEKDGAKRYVPKVYVNRVSLGNNKLKGFSKSIEDETGVLYVRNQNE